MSSWPWARVGVKLEGTREGHSIGNHGFEEEVLAKKAANSTANDIVIESDVTVGS